MAGDDDNGPKAWVSAIGAPILLFVLLTGISGSVDTTLLKESFKKWRGIAIGCSCQFVLLPAFGLSAAKMFDLDPVFGIPLIATTASPGGAYSNWWCSLLNADLALSVAMTACSTLVSAFFLPLNLLLYTSIAYGSTPELEIPKLLLNVALAVIAIFFGTVLSYLFPHQRKLMNIVGNVAGLCLIVFGALVSSRDDPIWDKEAKFYPAVAMPCVLGLICSFALSFFNPWLEKPAAVAITVETVYQNTGLALSIVLATFDEDVRGTAAGVPIYYAVVQLFVLPVFLVTCWKLGFTYAPPNTRIHKVLFLNWQPSTEVTSATPGDEDEDKLQDKPSAEKSDTNLVAPADGEASSRNDVNADGVWPTPIGAGSPKLAMGEYQDVQH